MTTLDMTFAPLRPAHLRAPWPGTGMVLAAALHLAVLGAVLAELRAPPIPEFPITVDIVADGALPATGGPDTQANDETPSLTPTHRLAGMATDGAQANDLPLTAVDAPSADTAEPEIHESLVTTRDPVPEDTLVPTDAASLPVTAFLPDLVPQTKAAAISDAAPVPPLPVSKPYTAESAFDDVVPAPTQISAPAAIGRTATAATNATVPASAVTGSIEDGPGGSGAATAPDFSDGTLGNKAPDYPYQARRLGQEGRVVLLVAVSAYGEVQAIEISSSSGHRLLDEAAHDAVAEWRFHPAHIDGHPMTGSVMVPIHFDLDD
ncbi:MAG: energy transducer TonB [Pseudomonadota bacterium]